MIPNNVSVRVCIILGHKDFDKVKWVNVWFTDILGILHEVTVPVERFRRAGDSGLGKLDGSSIKGFKVIEESDLVLKPVPETLRVLPWSNGEEARVIARVYDTGGTTRLSKDPRYATEKVEEILSSMGYAALVGPEVEFFIFRDIKVFLSPEKSFYEIHCDEGYWSESSIKNDVKGGYFTTSPYDKTHDLRREICDILEEYFDIKVASYHHEVAGASQVELDIWASAPCSTADATVTLKYVVRNSAFKRGLVATFMPKPLSNDNGSGMHVHLSLWSSGENAFYDENDDYAELSQLGRYFIGGLMEHSRSLSAIVAPTVNSYKRLVPGYEAPVYIAWSKANRSAIIRVPYYHERSPNAKRVEYRTPDPSANPYLAYAAMLMAGLDGIKKKIDPGDPVDENIYHMTPEKRRELNIKSLPGSLIEALDELEVDNEYLKPAFSKDLIETFIEIKREEYKKLAGYISPAEFYYYANL